MQKEISKAKRGEVTYTWDTSEDIPRLNLWNFKGEKITSFYISKIPKKASDAFLTKNKSELKMKAQEFYKKHQDSTKQYVIQQHYGKCNSEVSDRDFVEAANTIIKVLNASNNQENAHK